MYGKVGLFILLYFFLQAFGRLGWICSIDNGRSNAEIDKKSCLWEGSNEVKAQLVWMVQRKQRLWTKNARLITICCSGTVTGSVSSSASYVLGFQKAATWRDSVYFYSYLFRQYLPQYQENVCNENTFLQAGAISVNALTEMLTTKWWPRKIGLAGCWF